MPYTRKISPRAEYRLRRNEEINNSPTLAEKFPKLKTLQVTLNYFDSNGEIRSGGMKYKVNVAQGKSRFCFNCVNNDCAGGDFDLSEQLAHAIAGKRKLVEGEVRCQGIRHNKEKKQDTPCQAILRFKFALGY